MVSETYTTFDAINSNTISNGESDYESVLIIYNKSNSMKYQHEQTKYFEYSTSIVTCLKDGKEVLKSSVECEVKIGCKLIQRTGECCPEYQCGEFGLTCPLTVKNASFFLNVFLF